eukprot:7819973-Alexandrium_andersonii.AAC.1
MNCDSTLAEDTNLRARARRRGLRHVCNNENKHLKIPPRFLRKSSGRRGHLAPNLLAEFQALSGSRGNAH